MMSTLIPLYSQRSRKTRRRVLFFLAWVVIYTIAAAPAQAKTQPDGIGGLFTIPILNKGDKPMLFEAYGPQRYQIYNDLGFSDAVAKFGYVLYEALNELSYAIVKVAIGLTWWLTELTGASAGTDAIAQGVGSTARAVEGWILPTAIAVGALIAYIRARQGTSDVLGQVLTVLLAAGAVIGVGQSAPSIIGGLDGTRVVMAKTVNSLGTGAIAKLDEPFKFAGDPPLAAGTPYAVQRKSGDVVWRQFFVTPWCQQNFGSQAACRAYGNDWLAQPDYKARQKYLNKTIAGKEGGGDSETVNFIKGKSPGTRIGISLFALILAIGGAVVIGGLAFFALLPWLLALVLMFLAVFFLCMIVVPGRPRQIGVDYLQSILGLTLLSALSGGLLSAMLLVLVQASKLAGTKGWLPAMLFSFAALGGTWEARKLLSRLLTGSAGGGGAGGLLAGLALSRMGGRSLSAGLNKITGGRRGSGSSGRGTGDSGSSASPSTPPRRGGGNDRAGRHAAPVSARRAQQFYSATSHARKASAGTYATRPTAAQSALEQLKTSGRVMRAHATGRGSVNGEKVAGRTPGSATSRASQRGATSRNVPPRRVSHEMPAGKTHAGSPYGPRPAQQAGPRPAQQAGPRPAQQAGPRPAQQAGQQAQRSSGATDTKTPARSAGYRVGTSVPAPTAKRSPAPRPRADVRPAPRPPAEVKQQQPSTGSTAQRPTPKPPHTPKPPRTTIRRTRR